jgi:hypothetical protein
MRPIVLACLVLTAVPAAAQSQYGERYTEPTQEILVTGIRVQDYRDRLAACLARNCPPDEDIDATLALAEALLLEGDYGDARTTVRASLGRNRDEARTYPEPVSDLYRAYSRLSRHLGDDRAALQSTHGILDALQEGLPQEDHRHFTARLELAEMQMMSGRYSAAKRELERLIRRARGAGREDVAVMAELRGLMYDHIAVPHGPARARLIEMSRWTDPGRRLQSVGARVLLARIYRSEGDGERADALLAEIGRGSSTQRRLLHSPPYQLLRQEVGGVLDQDAGTATLFGNVRNRVSENYEGKWIDVGFWVARDGRVSELEVLRTGGDTLWAQPLLESIRGRIYSTAEEPTYRLERYTYTAAWQQATGTRIRERSPAARVEYLDLTVDNPAPPPPPARTDGSRPS